MSAPTQFRDPGRLVRKALLAVCMLGATAAMAADKQLPRSPFPTAPAQSHRFTVTEEYNYVERQYQPALLVNRLPTPPAGKLQYPEDVLISQMSAIAALDYDWWLSTFDEESQKFIRDNKNDANASADSWKQLWKPRSATVRVLLTRWILSGDFVILAYRFLAPPDSKTAPPAETAQAFRLTPDGWRATLRLANDPVVLHFGDPRDRFEMVVRP